MNRIKALAAVLAAALSAFAANAQDVKGSKDHPAIKRYEGSSIVQYDMQNFETLLIPTAKLAFEKSDFVFPKAIKVEGKVSSIRYQAPAGRTSLEVFRNYESALKGAGFQILYSCQKAECGDGDTFAQNLYGVGAQPLTLNQSRQAYLSAKREEAGTALYVRLFTIENESWPGNNLEKGRTLAQLDVVETKAVEGGMVTVDASAMGKALQSSGRVALYGIYFDSGKSAVKAESGPALDEIAKLLSANKSLRLLVVGHTDTDGTLAANRELSEQRAKAVVAELVSEKGIAAARLIPVGVGFAAPVATNRTADGKAKNRRVELVEY